MRDDLPMMPRQEARYTTTQHELHLDSHEAGNTAYGTTQPCSVGDHEKGAAPYLALVG